MQTVYQLDMLAAPPLGGSCPGPGRGKAQWLAPSRTARSSSRPTTCAWWSRSSATATSCRRPEPRLGLTLVTVADLAEATRRSRPAGGASRRPEPSLDGVLDGVLAGCACRSERRYSGWVPTMGKNRTLTGVQFKPYTGGGFDRPTGPTPDRRCRRCPRPRARGGSGSACSTPGSPRTAGSPGGSSPTTPRCSRRSRAAASGCGGRATRRSSPGSSGGRRRRPCSTSAPLCGASRAGPATRSGRCRSGTSPPGSPTTRTPGSR